MDPAPGSGHRSGWIAGFPAHAGMDLVGQDCEWRTKRRASPHTRGWTRVGAAGKSLSRVRAPPHTRGWTRRERGLGTRHPGFPAHAGMDRTRIEAGAGWTRLPRTRGDGPESDGNAATLISAPPHTRGWTRRGRHVVELVGGSPAHAGMDPWRRSPRHRQIRLPRTRGDGPAEYLGGLLASRAPPAHAGMDPNSSAAPTRTSRLPRTRGDGPFHHHHRRGSRMAPPHTRGWTLARVWTPRLLCGSPAHAGMDPVARAALRCQPRLPRTRGDGPEAMP